MISSRFISFFFLPQSFVYQIRCIRTMFQLFLSFILLWACKAQIIEELSPGLWSFYLKIKDFIMIGNHIIDGGIRKRNVTSPALSKGSRIFQPLHSLMMCFCFDNTMINFVTTGQCLTNFFGARRTKN